MNVSREKKLVIVSLFSSISAILYCFIKFPLPIFPSFLELNFSMIPIYIVLFMFGLRYSLFCVLLRFIFKILLVSTSTAYVGELADVIIGVVTLCSSFLVYNNIKNNEKNKTISSMIAGCLGWVLSACVVNVFILIPMYLNLYFDSNLASLVAICQIIPGINESNFMLYYVVFAVIPFNLLLSIIVSIFTYIVHIRTYKYFKLN